MKKIRLVLALLIVSCGASSLAQYDDGDAIGGICQVGDYNCQPGIPGGGGAPVDPSPYDPAPDYGDNQPDDGNQRDQREVYLGQYFRDQSLDLMRLLNLSSARWQRIESVELTVREGNQYSQVSLIADGYTEDSQSTWGSWITLQPRRDLIIGQNLRNLRLDIRGKLWVERIIVRLSHSGGYQPNPPQPPGGGGSELVLPGYVNQNFHGIGNVDLAQVTRLHQYPGYRVKSVTVWGRALNNYSARARVLANGMILGQLNFGNGLSGQQVRVQHQLYVGQNLNSLNLIVDDPARIDRVEVHLSRY